MKKSLIQKIGFNTASQAVGKIFSVLLGLISVGLLTRYLGASGYGDFTLVFAYLSFFGIIADFGLQLAIVRELSQNNIKASAIYGTYFWLKLSLVILSTLLALAALLFFPYTTTLKLGIVIGALGVGIGGLTGFGTAIFQSNLRLDLVTLIDVVTKIITVGLIVLFVFLKFNFYYIISTVLIGNILGFIITALILKRMIKFNFNFNSSLAKKIMIWSIPIGFTSFFSVVYFRLDTIMLSVMKGSYEVGIYGLSYKVFENILMFWGFYMASVYPLLAKYKNEGNKAELKSLVKNSIGVALLFSLVIIIFGFIFSPFIVSLFGGNNFSQSTPVFRVLLLATVLMFINNLLYSTLLVFRKIRPVLVIMAVSIILNFLMNLYLIPKYSYIGASITTIFSELIILIGYAYFFKKNILIHLRSNIRNEK